MSTVLEIKNLCKNYPTFSLKNVGFSVEAGTIMGFIGRNGAGKTTTLKSLLHLVHPDSGDIRFFGLSLSEHEHEIKQSIGFATGGVNYYPRKPIREIVATTKTFFDNWDDEVYRHYMEKFQLDENKKPAELSEGMKVKCNLALALSHHAKLLLLDEPTSGLDPVSRNELLQIFRSLADTGVAVLFSTHITSDLDRCADSITYLRRGEVVASAKKDEFVRLYENRSLEDIMLLLESEVEV